MRGQHLIIEYLGEIFEIGFYHSRELKNVSAVFWACQSIGKGLKWWR